MATFRIKKDKDNPYVMVNKRVVLDPRLSYRAKGVLIYLLSRPDDWIVYEREIAKHSTDGPWSVKMAIRELIAAGYITREKLRHQDTGKYQGYQYTVRESPLHPPKTTEMRNTNVGESLPTNTEGTNSAPDPNGLDVLFEIHRQDRKREADQLTHWNLLNSIKTDTVAN